MRLFPTFSKGEFFIDNLLVRIQFIIVMIRWTGLAPLEFELPFPGSFSFIFLGFFLTSKEVRHSRRFLASKEHQQPEANYLLRFKNDDFP